VKKTTTSKQIEDWKTELALVMVNLQWRRALQLCSWLRYALEQQDRSDPEVEQMHHRAKEALAEQVAQEREQQARQKEHRRLRRTAINHIASGTWMQALDSIEALYRSGANRQETFDLLRELKICLSDRLFTTFWRQDSKAAALAQRFNAILGHVRGDS
jgi:hypothetical protein